MKLPKDFIPDKDLEDKIEELKYSDSINKPNQKGLINLNDLIIEKSEFPSVSYHELGHDYFEKYYPNFESEHLSESIIVICGLEYVTQADILEFQYSYSPEENIEDVQGNLKQLNSYLKSYKDADKIKALAKDNFVVYIWMPPKSSKDSHPDIPKKLIQRYKNLGLKEIKAD